MKILNCRCKVTCPNGECRKAICDRCGITRDIDKDKAISVYCIECLKVVDEERVARRKELLSDENGGD